MSEVSCRAFDILVRAASARAVGLDTLVAGTTLAPADLENPNRRIAWSEFARVMENARAHFRDEDFVAMGSSFFDSRFIRPFAAAGRLLFSARDFYTVIGNTGAAGNQLFSCIVAKAKPLGTDKIAIELTLPEGYPPSPAFFLITRGAYEHLPRLVGHAPTTLTMAPIERGVRYEIVVPEGHGWLFKLQQAVTWPFRAKGVADALEETNRDLIARNIELEEARQNLERRVEERTAELKTANDHLALANAEIKQAQLARDRFFANISHEVRSPLTLVRLAASQLEKSPNMPASAGKALGSIEANVSRLLHLVDGLLLLAAGQEGKLKLKKTITDLAHVVSDMVTAWEPACAEREIAIAYTGPDTLQGAVDRAGLERMVSNFISNATKFTPAGGRIDVRLAVADGMVRVDVQDSGIGIPAEALGRLFGRFEQGPAPVRAGERGSGIGLAIVKELAEGHGGRAFASSEVGKGTCMSIELPLTLEGTVPQVEERLDRSFMVKEKPKAEAVEPEADQTGGATIVLAEDDPGLREAIRTLLSSRYRVIATPDGKQALAATKVHRPDILVTDLEMPEMNGLELSREFRKVPGNALVPILMVTAHNRLEERLEGFDAGAVDYVTKPFLPEELLARVGALLALRRKAIDFHTQEKLLSLGVLSASLAHEIRNPVNGMVNALEPLRAVLGPEALAPGSAAGELFGVLEESAVQVATLSKQLLGFVDKSPLAMRDADVGEVVNRAITLLGEKLRGVTIEKDYKHTGPVPCSPPFLCQVFVNLLDNAAQATGRGGWIRISTETTARELVVVVADSGPGIDPAIHARLFEPFVSTKKQAHGTGLGLFTSRQVMDRHGGTINYVAPASFRVVLPLGAPTSPAPGAPRSGGALATLPGAR